MSLLFVFERFALASICNDGKNIWDYDVRQRQDGKRIGYYKSQPIGTIELDEKTATVTFKPFAKVKYVQVTATIKIEGVKK